MIINNNGMENLGERIVYAMNIRGVNPNRLAVLSGIHASTVKNYISNATKPDGLKLDKIAEVLDVSKEWLKEGIGEMEADKKENPSPEGKGFDVYKENEILKKQNELNSQTITELLKTVGELLKNLNK